MIRLSRLSAGYIGPGGERRAALDGITLHIPRGTTCALIGPSGCGKSTLLRILAGIAPPSAGEIRIAGAPVDPRSLSIGFIPQTFGLLPWKTVRDNIRLSWRIKHPETPVPPDEAPLLARLGLGAGLLPRYPRALSGGQQQRAALARAFLLRPDLLLMDEPFSALDAITREEMQDTLLTLWRAQTVTTLLVTHDIEEALYLGQAIAVLTPAPGRLRALLQNPLFARREAPARIAREKTRLRALLAGKEPPP